MKKKSYQKPLMVSEEFVPQEYVAACSPDISWQPKPNATPYSSDSHFWIDKNNNGILDTNEQINSNRYTCDNSGALPNGAKGQYVFGIVPLPLVTDRIIQNLFLSDSGRFLIGKCYDPRLVSFL